MRRAVLVVLVVLLAGACGPGGPSGSQLPRAGAPAAQPPPAGPDQPAAAAAPSQPPAAPPQRVTIGVSSPSLSYLPAYLAEALGFYREEGIDAEFVLIGGTSVIPALASGELDFTILLSAVGAHAAQGGSSRIVQYHSVRIQHVVGVRPDITSVQQLAGKRVAVQSLSTLTAFEMRKLAEHFGLRDVALLAVGGELERIAAIEAGAADATPLAIPSNLVAERRGLTTLMRVGDVVPIPQAGLGTSENTLRDRADMVTRVLRGAARALPVISSQREVVVQKIAEWVELPPEDAARAYDMVVDTYTPNGLPTDAQLAAYIELLRETAGAPESTRPEQIADFTIARRVAAELGLPSQ